MQTKLFKTLAATAMSVLAIACAKEPSVADGNGETTEVSFEVAVPEVEAVTKGISDASTTDELVCQVFLNDADKTPIPELTQIVPIDVTTHKATVKFSLVKRNSYAFIFWAQAKDTKYYNTDDLRSVKMNVDKVKANEPKMDAFWGAITTKRALSNPMSNKITLLRALAQVNFGTVIPNRADALTVESSSVKLTGVPNTFHPFLGGGSKACEGSVDITYKDNTAITDEKLHVGETDYTYMATAYVFALKENRSLTNASTTVKLSNGETTTVDAPNAPIQRNFRTNILGNLLMVDAEWNVSIDNRFGGDDIEYDAVSANLEAGKNVKLSENYSVKDAGALVKTADGTMAVLDLNGHNFVNSNSYTKNAKAALQVHGNLTIKGDGTVSCNGGPYASNAIVLESGAHLIIEGGYYFVNKAGNETSNATIYVSDNGYTSKNNCLVEIYGGKFEAEVGNDGTPFVLNQADNIPESCFIVYGGTFVGFNPADVNENYGNITSFVAPGYKSVKVEGVSPETWEVVDASISVTDQTAFETTLSNLSGTDDVIIKLGAGEYEFTKADYKGHITIKGAGKDVTKLASNKANFDNKEISFEDLTFNCNNAWVADARVSQFPRTDVTYRNCVLNGTVGLIINKCAEFYDCTFNVDSNNKYCIEYYGNTKSKAVFDNCTFNTHGKCILIYNEAANVFEVNVNNCKFNASETVAGKTAIQMHTEKGISGVLTVNNTTATGFDTSINGGLWNDINNDTKEPTKKFTVTVEGTTVQTAE